MELAEKMDTGHKHAKKRRQSSETVSTMLSSLLSVKIQTFVILLINCILSLLHFLSEKAPTPSGQQIA